MPSRILARRTDISSENSPKDRPLEMLRSFVIFEQLSSRRTRRLTSGNLGERVLYILEAQFIGKLKLRLVKVQQMNKDLEEYHEEIIHECKSAIGEQFERFKGKLLQEEMESERMREEVGALTEQVEKLSQEKVIIASICYFRFLYYIICTEAA